MIIFSPKKIGVVMKNWHDWLLPIENEFVFNKSNFLQQPNISRTKDLYYAANFLERHYNQIGNIHNENAFSICLREIFSKDYSIACFEPKKVCSLHCAHDNFESIEKEKERFINALIANENN